ncbi:unnamed protein product [Rotaria sordida]|uniref:Uncharacterized protein n=1 Tax=Rotaria sordida TaxID=392033 RepID=A0A816D5N9_9BILA|nr:unnamed protein product [Rotaria sordida]CAF1632861.1 unnamed protein product [Rotaria sordida]
MNYTKIFVFTQIFIQYPNLQYLNFCPSSSLYVHLSFSNSSPIFVSSNLLELHVCLTNFTDCLYILDGRFNQLRTFYVNISLIKSGNKNVDKEKKLSNLKCFSLHCYKMTDAYNEVILPFLYRMSNLEELDLSLFLSVKEKFLDGNDIKKNLLNQMIQLNKFTFNIYSIVYCHNQINLQSNEDIQNTFNDYKYNKIICSIDYLKKRSSQCRIYSYPYKLKFYNYITNNFSGELFKCVRQISLFDEKPFEHEFFLRIEKSFPFLENISIRNFQPQNNKSCTESNKDNQHLSIVKYPYLTNLSLIKVHDDYIEQFLVYTKNPSFATDSSSKSGYSYTTIEQILQYSLCLDRFHNPRALSFQHIYCYSYLKRIISSNILCSIITCSICRHIFPYDNSIQFSKSYIHNQLFDLVLINYNIKEKYVEC